MIRVLKSKLSKLIIDYLISVLVFLPRAAFYVDDVFETVQQ